MKQPFLIAIILALFVAGGLWLVWKAPASDADRNGNGLVQDVPQATTDELVAPKPEAVPDKDPEAQGKPETDLQTVAPKKSSKEAVARNKAAIDALNAKKFAEATKTFEELSKAHPDEQIFQNNWAEALVRWALHDYDEDPVVALARLEQAITLAPERPNLLDLRDRWRNAVAAQEGFVEDQSLHFVLQYDGQRSELLSRGYLEVLDDLEAAYQDHGEFFGVFPVEAGRPKFRAVLYDREGFDLATGIGEWAGGAFDGTIRVPVANFQRERPRIRVTLRHELVHAFVVELGGKQVPGWLNEGLAQLRSYPNQSATNGEVEKARQRLAGVPLFSLADLQGTLAGIEGKDQIRKAYDQSLAFSAWILRHYGQRTVEKMVRAHKAGSSASAAFQTAIGIALSTVHQDFSDSL